MIYAAALYVTLDELNCDLSFGLRGKNKPAFVPGPRVNTLTEDFAKTHSPFGNVSSENHR